MRSAIVIALLVLAGVAHASPPIDVPKGWKREKLADAPQIASAASDLIGDVRGLRAAWWQAPETADDPDDGWLMTMRMVVTEDRRSPQAVIDGLLDEIVSWLEHRSSPVDAVAPKVKHQAVAVRQLESMTNRMHLQARAQRRKNGVHLLLVLCSDSIAHDDCRRAMKTIRLR